jgi:hypothetical protein
VSILKPEGSLTVGLAVGAMAYGIYSFSLPTGAIMNATQPQSLDIESARRKAAWSSVTIVAFVSLLAKDKTIFILGGMVVVALDFHARLANASAPGLGKVVSSLGYTPAREAVSESAQAAEAY